METDIKEWPASIPMSSTKSFFGRLSLTGGTLAISEDAVLFRPLAHLGRTRRYPFIDIVSVEIFANRPPRLRIELRQGKQVVFMVSARRLEGIWSRDTSARDEVIEDLNSRLERGPAE